MLAPCLGKFGGIETFCLTLIEDLIKRGASVRLLRKKVAGFQDDGSIQKNENEIRSSWTEEKSKRFATEFVSPRDAVIKKAIRESDLVHLHNPMVEGVWHAKKFNKPCVMTIYNWRRKGIHPRLLAWRWAVNQADRRWYISEFVWDSWEKSRRLGSARLPVVSRMPQKETSPDKRKGFFFIGRWIPNKGIRTLIEAYRRLAPDTEKWPLILAGDGPLKEEVQKFIVEHNVKGIRILGFITEEKRHFHTSNAKWMVTPPHTQEDLGLTPLEARAVGVPCIVSKDGGVLETGGELALKCKPGSVDSLLECLEKAINMTEENYSYLCTRVKDNLSDYVRPLDQYAKNYLQILNLN
jgi:glycosyltransferase involved in cell wall biosynthesis